MSKLKAEQLADLSVADILNLTTEEIAERSFLNLPNGMYQGRLVNFTIPDPEAQREFFESAIVVDAVIELADDSEEHQQAAADYIAAGNPLKSRFYTAKGHGITNMRTAFGSVINAVAGEGQPLGVFFSAWAENPSLEIPVNFLVSSRKDKNNPDKSYTDLKEVMPA